MIERTFRTLERGRLPELDKLGKPLINEEGFVEYTKTPIAITDEQKNILGSDGLRLESEWGDRIQHWADESQSFGMPFDELQKMGYFPRVITDAGRKLLESRKSPILSDFELDDLGNVVYRDG